MDVPVDGTGGFFQKLDGIDQSSPTLLPDVGN